MAEHSRWSGAARLPAALRKLHLHAVPRSCRGICHRIIDHVMKDKIVSLCRLKQSESEETTFNSTQHDISRDKRSVNHRSIACRLYFGRLRKSFMTIMHQTRPRLSSCDGRSRFAAAGLGRRSGGGPRGFPTRAHAGPRHDGLPHRNALR